VILSGLGCENKKSSAKEESAALKKPKPLQLKSQKEEEEILLSLFFFLITPLRKPSFYRLIRTSKAAVRQIYTLFGFFQG
jgi:hypothetical protein